MNNINDIIYIFYVSSGSIPVRKKEKNLEKKRRKNQSRSLGDNEVAVTGFLSPSPGGNGRTELLLREQSFRD